MTKKELFKIMNERLACPAAMRYVREHNSDDAIEIGETCERIDWLIWFLEKENRLDRFVCIAVRRSKKMDPFWGLRAEYRAKEYFNSRSWNRAYEVAFCAYSLDREGEKERQLKGLHRLWREWCEGKPKEKRIPF